MVANSAVAAGLFWSLCLSYGKGPCLRALTARPEEKKGDGWIDRWMDGWIDKWIDRYINR